MSLNPGQSLHGNACEETRVAAESLAEGDAAALDNNGEVVKADDTTNTTVYGVVGDDHTQSGYAAGDAVPVIYKGPVVANVASNASAGVELGPSSTDGQLASGSSAKGLMTKYEEGAGPADIPSGFAHVDV